MDSLKLRGKARIVAYIDLVFSSLKLLFVFGLFVVGVLGTGAGSGMRKMLQNDEKAPAWFKNPATGDIITAFVVFYWILIVTSAITVGVEMWAAIKLLKSTELGYDFGVAVKRARTWRNVSIILIVISIAFDIILGFYISLVVDIIVRGLMITVVVMYINELEDNAFGGIKV